jgi:hypothetical protein
MRERVERRAQAVAELVDRYDPDGVGHAAKILDLLGELHVLLAERVRR